MNKALLITTLLLSISAQAYSDDSDPTHEECLARFAQDYVPEYNSSNDYLISETIESKEGVLEVIKSNQFSDWVIGFAEAQLQLTDAVGVVFNYGDELSLIYAAVDVRAGKCQVKELIEVNTVDIQKNDDKTLLQKYFLGIPESNLKNFNDFYEAIKLALAGE